LIPRRFSTISRVILSVVYSTVSSSSLENYSDSLASLFGGICEGFISISLSISISELFSGISSSFLGDGGSICPEDI